MNIIAFLIVGIIAGWIGSLFVEGHGLGIWGDMIIGVIGAFVGGFIFNSVGVTAYGFWGTVGTSAVGAIVFLFLIELIVNARRPLGKM